MKTIIKAGIICLAISLVMLVFASAATPREMYENGVVSDDGIRHGDARDGEVSDVSEGGDIFSGEGTGILGDMINGTDAIGKDNTTAIPDMASVPSTSATDTSGDANDGEGMGMGVIIAVLVVIAVIVIIFLLLPKRR